jgi:hypothetical protein
MSRTRRQRQLLIAAILFAAGPLVAGGIGLLSRRHDPRMLSMAMTAGGVALLVVTMGRMKTVAATFTAALLLGTLVAAGVAYAAGARAPFGIWAVALVLAFFWATSAALYQLAHSRATDSNTRVDVP